MVSLLRFFFDLTENSQFSTDSFYSKSFYKMITFFWATCHGMMENSNFQVPKLGFHGRGGGIDYSSKPTSSTSWWVLQVKTVRKLSGNERFRKSEISPFIIIKNYWNRFINKKVREENLSDFDDEKWSAFLSFVLPVTVKQRRETLYESWSFFIIKLRYIFRCNFFVCKPISIIFSDYESWDLALSETLISGEF